MVTLERRDQLAIGAAVALGAVAYLVPQSRYGVGLTAFCIWMAWFVAWAVDWISTADF